MSVRAKKLFHLMTLKGNSLFWKPQSHLLIAGDENNWVLSLEALAIKSIAEKIGIHGIVTPYYSWVKNQSMFITSKYFLCQSHWLKWKNRIALPYYHGIPGTGSKEFDKCYESLRKHHKLIDRIQITHDEIRDLLLTTGIEPRKIYKIYIGIDLHKFPRLTSSTRAVAREQIGIPQQAFVIGSFQKDGVGWGDGLEPKLIKGPDLFLETMRSLADKIPELYVLLSGPARGFVMKGLERLGIPYQHAYLEKYTEISRMYHACNAYLVASRQEGGPKAILEAMATGVPIVSTRVGQAQELIIDGKNGFLAAVGDTDRLAENLVLLFENTDLVTHVTDRARTTAELNSYDMQLPQWNSFFSDFVGKNTH
jgi:glycosyltransferase involved in cell wall biosynthesis